MENDAEVPAGQRAGRDKQGRPQKGTAKQRGELAEMRFMSKAAGNGFGVAKPWGESERYDFILDSGGELLRVQVKSTYAEHTHGYVINSGWTAYGKKKAYSADQIDFLVAYIVAEDIWYVIPLSAFAPRGKLRLYPSAGKSKNGRGYERYREAWDLMKPASRNRDLDRSWALGEENGRKRPARPPERPPTT
ncbi:MAG: group I intron-associated PD-(D/E)XK endonuclease [Terriglobales bacterium]